MRSRPKHGFTLVELLVVIAIIALLVAILIYIWLRFEWQFAVGAVLALVHDVVLTIGVFSELQIRFDLAIIAALLTIVDIQKGPTIPANTELWVNDQVPGQLRLLFYATSPLAKVPAGPGAVVASPDCSAITMRMRVSRPAKPSGTTKKFWNMPCQSVCYTKMSGRYGDLEGSGDNS